MKISEGFHKCFDINEDIVPDNILVNYSLITFKIYFNNIFSSLIFDKKSYLMC